MDYIFPGEDIVFPEWITGDITIPVGHMINYVHGGYNSIHEGGMHLTFNKGVLVNETVKWLTPEQIKKIQEKEDNLPF